MTAVSPQGRSRKLREAAAELGISYDLMQRKVKAREWPCHYMGREYRIFDDDIAEILRITKEPVVTTTAEQPSVARIRQGLAVLDRAKTRNTA